MKRLLLLNILLLVLVNNAFAACPKFNGTYSCVYEDGHLDKIQIATTSFETQNAAFYEISDMNYLATLFAFLADGQAHSGSLYEYSFSYSSSCDSKKKSVHIDFKEHPNLSSLDLLKGSNGAISFRFTHSSGKHVAIECSH